MITLKLSEEEARYLQRILARIAARYDDPEAPVLADRLWKILREAEQR